MNANVIPSIDEAVDDGVDQVAVSAQKSSNPKFSLNRNGKLFCAVKLRLIGNYVF